MSLPNTSDGSTAGSLWTATLGEESLSVAVAGCGGLAGGSGVASGCGQASSTVAWSEGVPGTTGLCAEGCLVWEDLAVLAELVEVVVLWEPAKAAGGRSMQLAQVPLLLAPLLSPVDPGVLHSGQQQARLLHTAWDALVQHLQ